MIKHTKQDLMRGVKPLSLCDYNLTIYDGIQSINIGKIVYWDISDLSTIYTSETGDVTPNYGQFVVTDETPDIYKIYDNYIIDVKNHVQNINFTELNSVSVTENDTYGYNYKYKFINGKFNYDVKEGKIYADMERTWWAEGF